MELKHKEEIHIDRTYFKFGNPEDESTDSMSALEERLVELMEMIEFLECLKKTESADELREMLKKLLEEKAKQQEESQSQSNDSQEGNPQQGEGDGKPSSGSSGKESTEGTGIMMVVGEECSDPKDKSEKSLKVKVSMSRDEAEDDANDDLEMDGGTKPTESKDSTYTADPSKVKVTAKDFTKGTGGTGTGTNVVDDMESKKISVVKKKRFR